MTDTKLIPEAEMPHTRLELRWHKTDDPEWRWRCDYNLVIELWDLDIRGEVYNDDDELLRREKEKCVNLGSTKSDGGHDRLDLRNQRIHEPFRDGAHIQWDNHRLGGHLPMFVVCGGYAMALPMRSESAPEDETRDDEEN